MKRIAIFGKQIPDNAYVYIQELIDKVQQENGELIVYNKFLGQISDRVDINGNIQTFNNHRELAQKADVLLSLGGDGTMLDTLMLLRNSGIPVLGVNLGRLGFLASIMKEKIILAIDELMKGHYSIDNRTMIAICDDEDKFGEVNYALNEITVYKKDLLSMISVKVYINDEFVNKYWGDGIIIATPTGSTAYSLSCGGPIVVPESESFVITPIATHNMSVRPIVFSDNREIKIEVIGRENDFMVSLDSRKAIFSCGKTIRLRKADTQVNLIRMENENFFKTIRNKLLWGLDLRN